MMKCDLVAKAAVFARDRHQHQLRKGLAREPYITHVESVARLVASWSDDTDIHSAAWLHDVVEDCPPTSFEDIATLFNSRVAAIVAEVTDDKSLPKQERKRLQIVKAPALSYEACLIKLADKSDNLDSMVKSPPAMWEKERIQTYIEWAHAVVQALAHKPDDPLKHFLVIYNRAKEEYS